MKMPEAMFLVGLCYEFGVEEELDFEKALQLYKSAAEKELPAAMNTMGYLHLNGLGVDKSGEKALFWFSKSAQKGIAESMCSIGYMYSEGDCVPQNFRRAKYWFEKATANGSLMAFLGLGYLYSNGLGVEENNEHAFGLYENAALKGSPEGMFMLGDSYEQGLGCQNDIELALKWYKQAADYGDVDSLRAIGNLYQYEDELKNIQLALSWYHKAADKGDTEAMLQIAFVYYFEIEDTGNIHQAITWYKKSAEKGNAEAMYWVGQLYYNGADVPIDYNEAMYWYQKSADKSYANAMFSIGHMYNLGQGVVDDFKQAIEWYQKAADKKLDEAIAISTHFYPNQTMADQAEAMYVLGLDNFESTERIKRDYQLALCWFKRSADLGNSKAMCFIGNLYETGLGVEQNNKLAGQWYKKALDNGFIGASYLIEALNGFINTGNKKQVLFEIGELYNSGRGVINDIEKANDFYTQAANEGSADAMFAIGLNNVLSNKHKAFKWWFKGAKAGHFKAMTFISNCYTKGDGVEKDQKQALYWIKKGAELGDIGLMFRLGYEYIQGNIVKQDTQKALFWYHKVAEKGENKALLEIAELYMHGEGIVKDVNNALLYYKKYLNQCNDYELMHDLARWYEEGVFSDPDMDQAIYWYKKAAKRGQADDFFFLGNLYASGEKIPRDYKEAFYWYMKAAYKSSDAKCIIGNMYNKGLGVDQDSKEAFVWYKKAAKERHFRAGLQLKMIESERTLDLNNKIQSNTIRVFLSSTFTDMQEEREYLVNTIFPYLRALARSKGIELTEVDLRWGITEDDAKNGKVVRLCLKEIELCKERSGELPFFIGIIGNRYGWQPEYKDLNGDVNLKRDFPVVEKYMHENLSVTEMEMDYAVLNKIEQEKSLQKQAFFYYRSPDYLFQLQEENPFVNYFDNDKQNASQRLQQLKLKIAEKLGNNTPQQYCDKEDLGKQIIESFISFLNEKFTTEEMNSCQKEIYSSYGKSYHSRYPEIRLTEERWQQAAFAHNFLKPYVQPRNLFSDIDAILESDKHVLITGEIGSGKTAILANYIAYLQKQCSPTKIIYHFCGGSKQSHQIDEMLARLIAEIQFFVQKEIDTSKHLKTLPYIFEHVLLSIPANNPVLLIIDGVDLLNVDDKLYWLPPRLPEHIQVLFSIQSLKAGVENHILRTCKNKQLSRIELSGLKQDERELVVQKVLGRYSKELPEDLMSEILCDEESKNPLILNTLLEEMRLMGNHETLYSNIRGYLSCRSFETFFEKVLSRIERDFPSAKYAISHLVVSRSGLTESEIIILVNSVSHIPFTNIQWSGLHETLRPYLKEDGGVLSIANELLKKAVINKNLSTSESVQVYRQHQIIYFSQDEQDERSKYNLPWLNDNYKIKQKA